MENIKDFFVLHSETRFVPVDSTVPMGCKLAGYRLRKDYEEHFLMITPVFNTLVKGCNRTQLIQELKRQGWLVLRSFAIWGVGSWGRKQGIQVEKRRK